MTNTKRKGAQLEQRVIAILEAQGYLCERARANYAYSSRLGRTVSTAHDFFTAFDIIAKAPGRRTLWVQVTTKNVSVVSKVRRFGEVSGRFDKAFDDVQVWRWHTPDRPGQRGHFQVLLWDDEFSTKVAKTISTGSSSDT